MTITAQSGSADAEQFTYSDKTNDVFIPGQTFTFQALATSSITLNYTWQYQGNHSWFEASAGLQAFASGPSGTTTTVSLVASQTKTNGAFAYSGTSSLTVTAGYAFGFIASGENYDSASSLAGTLTITKQ
jgi:hypothetical protein